MIEEMDDEICFVCLLFLSLDLFKVWLMAHGGESEEGIVLTIRDARIEFSF